MRNIRFLILSLVFLPACFGSAMSARRAQTLTSSGWSCYSDPTITCPSRSDGVCSGWDNRWYATCSDTGVRYLCRFANEGATYGSSRRNSDEVICHAEPSTGTRSIIRHIE